MPAAHPPEFRRRTGELARLREKPIAQIPQDLGISESCLRGWMNRADVDEGRKEGVTPDEPAELVRLRRAARQRDGGRDPQTTFLGVNPGPVLGRQGSKLRIRTRPRAGSATRCLRRGSPGNVPREDQAAMFHVAARSERRALRLGMGGER